MIKSLYEGRPTQIEYAGFDVQLHHNFDELLSNVESAVNVRANRYRLKDIVSFTEYVRADDELIKIDTLKEAFAHYGENGLCLFDYIVADFAYAPVAHSLDEHYANMRLSLTKALAELKEEGD